MFDVAFHCIGFCGVEIGITVNGKIFVTWLGLSFERLCFAHVHAIQKALGVTGIATKTYPLLTPDAQMDMVIERADKVTSLCEMKYTNRPYALTKHDAERLRLKEAEVSDLLPTQKQVLISLVTKGPAKKNEYYNELVSNNITLDSLFND